MNNKLLLLSRGDIPFEQAQLVIHQPTLKEISYIGERTFFTGCQLLNFSKEDLNMQDKSNLEDFTNFEVLMTIIKNQDIAIKKSKVCLQLVLLLLFPDYKINFLPMSIMLSKESEHHLIDKENFEIFRDIVSSMFCLDKIRGGSKEKYNPGGPQAKALVQKFKKRHQKLAQLKKQSGEHEDELFESYVSILAVGQRKDINELMQYSVYQLFNQLRRFKMKNNFDLWFRAKMAGAQNLQDIDNWMGTLNSSDNS